MASSVRWLGRCGYRKVDFSIGRGGIIAACCLAVLLASGTVLGEPAEPAAAQVAPRRVNVERSRAALDCPDTARLIELVNRTVRATVVVPAVPEESTELAVVLDRTRSGYEARIEASAPFAGVRIINDPGPRCDELSTALAISIALLLDPTFTVPDREATPSDTQAGSLVPAESVASPDSASAPETGPGSSDIPSEAAAAEAAPPSTVRPDRASAPMSLDPPPIQQFPPNSQQESSRSPGDAPVAKPSSPSAVNSMGRHFAGPEIGAAAAFGITFDVAAATWTGLFASHAGWSGHLSIVWLPETGQRIDSTLLYLDLWAGSLAFCRALWSTADGLIGASACANVLVGAISARASNVTDATPATAVWMGLGGGPVLTGRILGPLEWRLIGTALAPVVDERFAVVGQGSVHKPPRIAGLTGFSLGMSIW